VCQSKMFTVWGLMRAQGKRCAVSAGRMDDFSYSVSSRADRHGDHMRFYVGHQRRCLVLTVTANSQLLSFASEENSKSRTSQDQPLPFADHPG
jgi:hypothetical protein